MIDNLTIIIVSFIYSALLCFAYIKKNRSSKEITKILSLLFISNFFGLILNLASIFLYKKFTIHAQPTMLVNKLIVEYYSLFAYLFTVYALVATSGLEGKELNKFARNVKNLGLVAFILISLIIAFLPLSFYTNGTNINQAGSAVIAMYVFVVITLVVSLSCILRGIFNKKKKAIFPIFLYIIGNIANFIVQYKYPSMNITMVIETFILYAIYFSIDKEPPKKVVKDVVEVEVKKASPVVEVKEQNAVSEVPVKVEEPVNEKYDTKLLLKEVTDYAKSKLASSSVRLNTSIDSSIPASLLGDADMVKKILKNLIDNSTEEAGNHIDIKIDSINRNQICKFIVVVENDSVLMSNPSETVFETRRSLKEVKRLIEGLNGKFAVRGNKDCKYIVSFEQKIDALGSIGIKLRKR